jgi:putative nucleotidyltransferase with HDIG domain
MALPAGLIRKIGNLAPMPLTAQRLLTVINDETVSLADLAKIVEIDEALVSNTLKVANSVYFHRGKTVDNPRSAIVRLGATNLFNLILGQHLRQLSIPAPLYSLSENELWLHSIEASLAADEIIRASPANIPQVAKVAALVHDVGKLIMVRFAKADFPSARRRARERNLHPVEAERELFGCDHTEVGGVVAREWGFPENVTDAIQRHHDCPLEDSHPVLDTVVVANLVAKTLAAGLGAEALKPLGRSVGPGSSVTRHQPVPPDLLARRRKVEPSQEGLRVH